MILFCYSVGFFLLTYMEKFKKLEYLDTHFSTPSLFFKYENIKIHYVYLLAKLFPPFFSANVVKNDFWLGLIDDKVPHNIYYMYTNRYNKGVFLFLFIYFFIFFLSSDDTQFYINVSPLNKAAYTRKIILFFFILILRCMLYQDYYGIIEKKTNKLRHNLIIKGWDKQPNTLK